jgi:hypothetical protein
VVASRGQILSAIDRPMVRILQDPYFSSAFGGVELSHCLTEFQAGALHDVFAVAGITNDSGGNTENQALVTIEGNGKSALTTCLQLDSKNEDSGGGGCPEKENAAERSASQ